MLCNAGEFPLGQGPSASDRGFARIFPQQWHWKSRALLFWVSFEMVNSRRARQSALDGQLHIVSAQCYGGA
ncbi:hypothetical protein CBOM_07709 [Ceraceosorus bombacis]|uniref:Uncharacterized protein n=1 Tax=Ceraceosorus bombacis TaxID=401625 RepID=A0A0P1BH67_9BASI|nr:hypothetical protein CBOM_07709 [Ceraceosorus bombacis]